MNSLNDKSGYVYSGEVVDCDKLNEHDLLLEFAHRFEDYDHLKDRELEILGDHPNREFWDDELDKEYDDLLMDIDNAWVRLREIMRIVYKNKDFWVC